MTHSSPDAATLAEVQRLLADNRFASIDDLVARAGLEALDDLTDDHHGSVKVDLGTDARVVRLVEPVDDNPLPRRRSA